MAGKHREEEFERYPKFKQAYLGAFRRLIDKRNAEGKPFDSEEWQTAEGMFDWWMRKI